MADVEMGMSECDLQLRLCLGGNDDVADHDPPIPTSSTTRSSIRTLELFGESQESEQRKQPVTIIYAGRICVCDATEIEARSVISIAKAEMDAQTMTRRITQEQQQQQQTEEKSSSSTSQHSSVGELKVLLKQDQLPMKRSLHRFLERRKWRLHAASSPYTTRHPSRPCHRSSMAGRRQFFGVL